MLRKRCFWVKHIMFNIAYGEMHEHLAFGVWRIRLFVGYMVSSFLMRFLENNHVA